MQTAAGMLAIASTVAHEHPIFRQERIMADTKMQKVDAKGAIASLKEGATLIGVRAK